ncbi:MAG: copper chaperone PCu(A)C [Marinobacter sp.]|uniref:copper chaperone PCu(A)C n=1 Tax=Marinobacter sp. TaxID=50741 RepID=UPI00299DF6DF|nr:copper chaperone PCu(A)C [Marinobacter sp.]MDX1754537.1 copper chaperone PCu(A)C [Marinobacter sp.]
MKRLITLMLSVTGLVIPVLAGAHEYPAGQLHIDHPWTRPTPPGAMMGAGYMTIRNDGDDPVTLVAAQSPRAGHVSIHHSRMQDGVMRMDALPEGLTIPAGEQVELKPHSYHLMLEQLQGQLVEGERVPLTLTFEGAPEVEVELAVDPLDASSPAMGKGNMGQAMDHGGMDHGQMNHDH